MMPRMQPSDPLLGRDNGDKYKEYTVYKPFYNRGKVPMQSSIVSAQSSIQRGIDG